MAHAHWQTRTGIAALRHDRLEAPWLLDGPVNGTCCLASVERGLAPTPKPRDIVIIDNLDSHEAKAVRRVIHATGAALLPVAAYSPDLNPIDRLFAKLNHWLRTAAEPTRDALCRAVTQILDSISAAECADDPVNSGYART